MIAEESQVHSCWICGVPTTGVTIATYPLSKTVTIGTGSDMGFMCSVIAAARKDNW